MALVRRGDTTASTRTAPAAQVARSEDVGARPKAPLSTPLAPSALHFGQPSSSQATKASGLLAHRVAVNKSEVIAPPTTDLDPAAVLAGLLAKPGSWSKLDAEAQALAEAHIVADPDYARELRAAVVTALDDAYYHDTRTRVFRSLPPVVQSDPELAAAVIRTGTSWLPPDDERPAFDALLSSLDFLCDGQLPLASLRLVPTALLDEPRLAASVAQALGAEKKPALAFGKLPEPLRRDLGCAKVALAADVATALEKIPLDDASPALRREALTAARDALPNGLSWRDVPKTLRSDPELVIPALRAQPGKVGVLSDAERSVAAPLFTERAWVLSALGEIRHFASQLPADLASDPQVIAAAATAVEGDLMVLRRLPASMAGAPSVVAAASTHKSKFNDPFEHLPPGSVGDAAVALILQRGVDRLPDDLVLEGPLLAQAVELAKATIDGGGSIGALPKQLRERLDLRRAALAAQGHTRLESELGRAAPRDPELWSGAPVERVEAYLAAYPSRLAELPAPLSQAPQHVLTAVEHSAPRLRGLHLSRLDPALLDDAGFMDRLMTLVPEGFRFASERLRSDPERARRALLGSAANIGAERLAPDARDQLYAELASRPLDASPYGPAHELDVLRSAAEGERPALIGRALALAAMEVRPDSASKVEPHLLLEPGFVDLVASRAPAALASLPIGDLSPAEAARVTAELRAKVVQTPALFEHMPRDLRADHELVGSLIARAPRTMVASEGAARADPALWVAAASLDARVLAGIDPQSTLGKQLGAEPSRSQLRASAIAQLERGELPPPPGIPRVLVSDDPVVAAAIRVYGGRAVAGLTDSWFRHEWAYQAFADVVRSDPSRAAASLGELPRPLEGVLDELIAGGAERQVRAFAVALVQGAPALFDRLPSAMRTDPQVFRAALEGGARSGGLRGLDAMIARQSPDIQDLVTRDGRSDAAYARALSDAIAAGLQAGAASAWIVTDSGASGEVVPVDLSRTELRGTDVIVRDPPFRTSYPLAQLENLQIGGHAPIARPPRVTSEWSDSRAPGSSPAAWTRQVDRVLSAARTGAYRTVKLVDTDGKQHGPFSPASVKVLPDGSVAAPKLVLAAEQLRRVTTIEAPPRPEHPSIETIRLVRGSLDDAAWEAQVLTALSDAAHDATARMATRSPLRADGPARARDIRSFVADDGRAWLALPDGTKSAIFYLDTVTLERRRSTPEERAERQQRPDVVARMRLEIIRRDPRQILDVPEAQRTLAQWRTAAASSPQVFAAAPEEVRADREVVERVLRLDGRTLAHASSELRADPEVVRRAMDTAPKAYASALAPLTVPTDDGARQAITTLFDAGDVAGAQAAAEALVGPPGSARRELYLAYVRAVELPKSDVALLADPEVALAAASNGSELQHHFAYVKERLRTDPAFADAFVDAAPGWLRAMPPESVRPEHIVRILSRRDWAFLLETKHHKSHSAVGDEPVTSLDPRVSVPPERWQDIASKHPAKFAALFTPESIPPEHHGALRTALLAALAEDHRVLPTLSPSLTADLGFLAAAVRVSPLVLAKLSPSQRALLEVQSPREIASAREFLGRLEQTGLRELHRFDGHGRLLQQVVEDHFAPHDDGRPLAAVVLARADHNGAFADITAQLDALTGRYRLALYEASSVAELGDAVRDATRAKAADLLMLGGHGTRTTLALGNADDVDATLTASDLDRLRGLGLHDRVAAGGRVALMSCSSGAREDTARNTVNMLADLWPQATVSGQSDVSSSTLALDSTGLFAGLRYRSGSAHIPAYEVGPSIR